MIQDYEGWAAEDYEVGLHDITVSFGFNRFIKVRFRIVASSNIS